MISIFLHKNFNSISFKENWKDLCSFIKAPNSKSDIKIQKANLLLFCIIINTIVIFIATFLNYLFEYLETLQIFKGKSIALSEVEEFKFENKFLLFILVCSVVPMLEEFIYRLFLVKKYSFLIFLPFISLLFFGFGNVSFVLGISVVIIFFCYSLWILNFYNKSKTKLKSTRDFKNSYINLLYDRLFPLFFYTTTLIFSLSHIDNYNWSLTSLLPGGIILSIVFISDILFGYVMLRCGFWYAVLLHSLHNLVVFILP